MTICNLAIRCQRVPVPVPAFFTHSSDNLKVNLVFPISSMYDLYTYMKTIKISHEHVGKYSSPMDGMGFVVRTNCLQKTFWKMKTACFA